MRQGDVVRQFIRTAERRLLAAKALADPRHHGHFGLEAIYLAGYSIECSLKALLLHRTSDRNWKDVYAEITQGRRSHRFDSLKERLRRTGWRDSDDSARELRIVASWETDLRYETRKIDPRDVDRFLLAVERLSATLIREAQ